MRKASVSLLLPLVLAEAACTSVSVSRQPTFEPFPEAASAAESPPLPRAVTRPLPRWSPPPRRSVAPEPSPTPAEPESVSPAAAAEPVPSAPAPAPAPAVAMPEVPEAALPPPPVTGPPAAILALRGDADASLARGDYDNAAAALERALRIQPKNAEIWHQLAVVRLKQRQPGLAEDLAKRSNLHARGNAELIRSNWGLIAEARQLKGDDVGAAEAAARAVGP